MMKVIVRLNGLGVSAFRMNHLSEETVGCISGVNFGKAQKHEKGRSYLREYAATTGGRGLHAGQGCGLESQ